MTKVVGILIGQKMKAIVCKAYGSPAVLELRHVPKPTPEKDEILVQIVASTVTAGDCELRKFDFPFLYWLLLRLYMGIFKPRINILGQEYSGIVAEVGEDVKLFKPGDKVFGPTDMKMGAYAEFRCLDSKHPISIIPETLSFEEAATIPTGGLNALHFLRLVKIGAGTKVLINGAGGSIGTYAIQIAKMFGAEVTAIDSAGKLEMLQKLGADFVLDHKQVDYRRENTRYDLIFDIISRSWFAMGINALAPKGVYLVANPGILSMVGSLWYKVFSKLGRRRGVKVLNGLAKYSTKDLDLLGDWLQSGKIKAVIDRKFQMQDLDKAHEYVDSGMKKGNVVITMTN